MWPNKIISAISPVVDLSIKPTDRVSTDRITKSRIVTTVIGEGDFRSTTRPTTSHKVPDVRDPENRGGGSRATPVGTRGPIREDTIVGGSNGPLSCSWGRILSPKVYLQRPFSRTFKLPRSSNICHSRSMGVKHGLWVVTDKISDTQMRRFCLETYTHINRFSVWITKDPTPS